MANAVLAALLGPASKQLAVKLIPPTQPLSPHNHAQSWVHWRALWMPFGMRPALSLLRFATEFLIVLQPTVLKLRVCVQTLTDTVTRTLRIAHVPTSGHPVPHHEGSQDNKAGVRSNLQCRCCQVMSLTHLG